MVVPAYYNGVCVCVFSFPYFVFPRVHFLFYCVCLFDWLTSCIFAKKKSYYKSFSNLKYKTQCNSGRTFTTNLLPCSTIRPPNRAHTYANSQCPPNPEHASKFISPSQHTYIQKKYTHTQLRMIMLLQRFPTIAKKRISVSLAHCLIF